ncbi:AAEL003590-PA [Aedes aegypti]|uniref:AAEL003590-PA n=1 Tax=Aedes aegypti TaxID=7159 RepID=Q17F31_AEDAE|nr:AAEL003590-PA [Aedes aegypti]
MKVLLFYCIVACATLALGNPIDVISDEETDSGEHDNVEDAAFDSYIVEQPESELIPLENVESDEVETDSSLDNEYNPEVNEDVLVVLGDLLDFENEQEDEEDEAVQDAQSPSEALEDPYPKQKLLIRPLRLCALPPLYVGQKPQPVPSWWCQCPKGVIC